MLASVRLFHPLNSTARDELPARYQDRLALLMVTTTSLVLGLPWSEQPGIRSHIRFTLEGLGMGAPPSVTTM
jgi:hypothetical protein